MQGDAEFEKVVEGIKEVGTVTKEETPFDQQPDASEKRQDDMIELTLPSDSLTLLDEVPDHPEKRENDDANDMPEELAGIVKDLEKSEEPKEDTDQEDSGEQTGDGNPDEANDSDQPDELSIQKPEGMSMDEFVDYKLNQELRSVMIYTLPEEPIVQYLEEKCKADSELAAGVASSEKTLKGCTEYVLKCAQKIMMERRKGGVSYLPDNAVYEMVETYYKTTNAEIERKEKEEQEKRRKALAAKNSAAKSKNASKTVKNKKEAKPELPLEILAGNMEEPQEEASEPASKESVQKTEVIELPDIDEENELDLVAEMNKTNEEKA